METAAKILSDLTGIPEYRITADDNGEYITKKGALQAMEEYAAQYKNQSQPIEKEQEIKQLKIEASNFAYKADRAKQERDKAEQEIERLKGNNEHLSGRLNTSQEVIKIHEQEIERLKEELQRVYKLVDHWHTKSEELEAQLKEVKEIARDEINISAIGESSRSKLDRIYKLIESSPTEQPENKRQFDKLREEFLRRTSFKNVSGNWQFNGAITPERVFNITAELLKDNHIDPLSQKLESWFDKFQSKLKELGYTFPVNDKDWVDKYDDGISPEDAAIELATEQPEAQYIDHEGIRYWYEYRLAKHKVDICLATKDIKKYCNGTYLYSDKDPGDGMAYVVIKTEPSPSLIDEIAKKIDPEEIWNAKSPRPYKQQSQPQPEKTQEEQSKCRYCNGTGLVNKHPLGQ